MNEILFPFAGNAVVPLVRFVAAWKVFWTQRSYPHSGNWRTGAMPRGNRTDTLAVLLAAPGPFRLDVLCRALVPAAQNVMQATHPFMNANAHYIEHQQALNHNQMLVNGAALVDVALEAWDALAVEEQQRLEAWAAAQLGQVL